MYDAFRLLYCVLWFIVPALALWALCAVFIVAVWVVYRWRGGRMPFRSWYNRRWK